MLGLAHAAAAQTPPEGLQGQAFRVWLRENFHEGRHKTLTYVEAICRQFQLQLPPSAKDLTILADYRDRPTLKDS